MTAEGIYSRGGTVENGRDLLVKKFDVKEELVAYSSGIALGLLPL